MNKQSRKRVQACIAQELRVVNADPQGGRGASRPYRKESRKGASRRNIRERLGNRAKEHKSHLKTVSQRVADRAAFLWYARSNGSWAENKLGRLAPTPQTLEASPPAAQTQPVVRRGLTPMQLLALTATIAEPPPRR